MFRWSVADRFEGVDLYEISSTSPGLSLFGGPEEMAVVIRRSRMIAICAEIPAQPRTSQGYASRMRLPNLHCAPPIRPAELGQCGRRCWIGRYVWNVSDVFCAQHTLQTVSRRWSYERVSPPLLHKCRRRSSRT